MRGEEGVTGCLFRDVEDEDVVWFAELGGISLLFSLREEERDDLCVKRGYK